MKKFLASAICCMAGVAIYEIIANGPVSADWYRVIFVGVFIAIAMGAYEKLVPAKAQ